MNIDKELERLTQPEGTAKAKTLTPEEIRELQEKQEITPIGKVHRASTLPRVHFPSRWNFGHY